MAFGARLAKEVLGNLEAGCRLRRRQASLVVGLAFGTGNFVADHRLTKMAERPSMWRRFAKSG
jgi:hypothetical protein